MGASANLLGDRGDINIKFNVNLVSSNDSGIIRDLWIMVGERLFILKPIPFPESCSSLSLTTRGGGSGK